MKKLLAVFLALMMVLSISLMACKKTEEPNPDDQVEDDDDFIVNKNKGKDTTDTGDTDDSEGEGDDTSNGGSVSNVWVNETVTVYVRANGVNVRASANINASVLGTVNFKEALTSESHNSSWYKVSYGDKVAYISADFVTANQDTVLFEAPTTVAAESVIHVAEGKTCFLRSDPAVNEKTNKGSIDSTKTAAGELKILEINKAGTWAKVSFNGKTLENTTYTGTEIFYCTTSVIAELAASSNNQNGGLG